MRGHEEASGTKYVPDSLMAAWEERDPINNFRRYLLDTEILTTEIDEAYRSAISEDIDLGLEKAYSEEDINPSIEKELSDVFKNFEYQQIRWH